MFWRVPRHYHEIETSGDPKKTTLDPLENTYDAPTFIQREEIFWRFEIFLFLSFCNSGTKVLLFFEVSTPAPNVWYEGGGLL